MRRVSKVLISTAGALLIAPLAVASQALPANAATGTLLVTTLGRDGLAVPGQPLTLMNLASYATYYNDASADTFSIPDGSYAVLAGIEQSANGTTVGTIAATTATVTGTSTTKVTLDARKGHLIKATLDGLPVNDYADARVCVGSTAAQMELFESPGDLYVVPSTSPLYSFAFLAQGQGAVVTSQTASGIPSSPGGAWESSQLAKVSLMVRSNEQVAYSTSAELQPENADGSATCGVDLGSQMSENPAPFSYSERVSPGYWVVRTDDFATVGNQNADMGGYFVKHQFAAGHSYSYTYYSAAWAPGGPNAELPLIWRHSIEFDGTQLTDPGGNGFNASTRNAMTLSLNGHQVASGTVYDVANPAPFAPSITSAGWYTLTDTTTRYYPGLTFPSGILSPKATVSWRFYATPSETQVAAGFWTSFEPTQLSPTNHASPGTSKTVIIAPHRETSDPNASVPADSVTKLQVWSSADDGKTWQALAVHHSTSGWTVTVTTPASGFVSLRAEVTGSHGDTSTETIYRAYAVS